MPIIFKSNGGPHELWNLIPACRSCHASIHEGTLEVFRDSLGELHWRTRAERIEVLLEDELKDFVSIPSVAVVRPESPAKPPADSACEADPGLERESDRVSEAIQGLGYKKDEARKLVWSALEKLRGRGRPPTGDEIINTALLGRAVVIKAPVSADAENGSGAPEKV